MMKSKSMHKVTKLLIAVVFTMTIFIMMNKSASGTYGSIEKYFMSILNIVPLSYLLGYLKKLTDMKSKFKGKFLKNTPEYIVAIGYQVLSLYLIVYQFPIALAILVLYLLIHGFIKLLRQFLATIYHFIKA